MPLRSENRDRKDLDLLNVVLAGRVSARILFHNAYRSDYAAR